MIGFHIDMNIAQFTRGYLEKWLRELARLGYDTILWEVENNIRWETCPECVAPDAFSKDEFREILALCRELGMEPVPLLQTLGHCEYVLSHKEYRHLAESPQNTDLYFSQYCPQNPQTREFLKRWIEEYFSVFGEVRYFHLGADECRSLGECPRCAAYSQQHSRADLYVQHINALSDEVVQRGARPIIWADMALTHPEALEKLSRQTVLFDWIYEIYRGSGQVMIWGEGLCRKEQIPSTARARFDPFLFPDGDEPGREPETFYSADYLAHHGFDVVTCPGSSFYGDNVFAPRNDHHLANTFDSFQKGAAQHLHGSLLTSWTVHLFPWELQMACIQAGPFVSRHPGTSREAFQSHFLEETFGTGDADFWRAAGLLAKSCLFTHTASLGFNKSAAQVPLEHCAQAVLKIVAEGKGAEELANCRARFIEYREALGLFRAFNNRATKGHDLLQVWDWAARNLMNRAEISILLLMSAQQQPVSSGNVRDLLKELRQLRAETELMYAPICRPTRRQEMLDWMYASIEQALVNFD